MARSSAVLDASATLAVLFDEPGADVVLEVLPDAVISTVNWVEVSQRVRARGHEPVAVRDALQDAGLSIIPLSLSHAQRAADLRGSTRALGLSLADRCCLASALEAGLPVMTSDRAWAQTDVGVEVVLIR